MRHGWLISTCVLLGACLAFGASCAHAEDPYDPVLAELGAESFPRYCGSCHGMQARGDGPAAGALLVRPPDLTRIAARRGGKFPAGEIARFVDGRFGVTAHGSREMPIWGERFGEAIPDSGVSEEITRGKIAVIVEYLKSIQRRD
jgi:mono/diheme cytochrome c family protein